MNAALSLSIANTATPVQFQFFDFNAATAESFLHDANSGAQVID